ncbi:serrate RNA effector molecule homolog isoform X1 [Halyomorpha halys]|uniref:serrate RNA effector molecule homolog isoform X1 n=1 Tax=Halyomorpha halys TaxID=286706 RepID=UPI0006D4C7A0|nr:serrate RNA effector molecule homolog isoform X1 [Halyomorpha halys]
MGDSEDEYDKKRRDKFQGERSDSYRTDKRKDDDWGRPRMRNDYRDRYQYQGDLPPTKRMRYDSDDIRRMRYNDPGYGPYNSWGPEPPYPGNSRLGEMDTQPPIMTFKAFLQSQDDNITDEEAIAKYAEYKLEFRRQQLNEFFVAHKEEEWFKLKYHPEESLKRKEELNSALKKRCDVFLEMLESHRMDDIRVDTEQGDEVVKLLDSVVIRLEGGTDLDLTILDQQEGQKDEQKEKDKSDDKPKENNKSDEEEVKQKENEENKDEIVIDEDDERKEEEEKNEVHELSEDERPPGVDPESDIEKEDVPAEKESPSEKETQPEEKESSPEKEKKEEVKKSKDDQDSDKDHDEVVPLTPRALHKTSSIFLRTISPRVTKAEIESICKKYPGFLRVSLSEPQAEQHWYRRGWVTFRRDVNIKEICWNLNNIRVKECEMGAIVNRDLSRRVRSVSGLSGHKQVVLGDLKLAAKIIQELDSRAGFCNPDQSETFGLETRNAVFKGITEYLVEEAPAEEEELLGQGIVADESKSRIAGAIKILDKLLLYLRIVHSVDYYNTSQYTSEDEMPNRCGIMHLRGLPSSTEVSPQEIQEYIDGYKTKLEPLYTPVQTVTEQELTSLGAKDRDTEVEKFIQANTQELAKDKWLCPLSGKKFKGPEFVRKHIYNKFSQELEEVKKEVDYFNNYLRDPKRPQLAEHPGNRGGKKEPESPYHYQYGGGFKRGFGHFGGHGGFNRGRGGFGRGRGMDYRPIITYRDLDAPCEPDEII